MNLKSIFVALGLIGASLTASAQPFTLPDNNTGASYQCGQGGGGGGNIDPACTSQVSDFCYSNTSRNRDQCFNEAIQACGRGVQPACVIDTANYCYAHTSQNRDQCFDQAISACSGNGAAIAGLLNAVQVQSMRLMSGAAVTK